MRKLALLPLCCVLWACPPPIDSGVDGGGTGPIVVGPEGGFFIRECGALEIPKDALKETAQINMTPVASGIPEVNGRTQISVACRMSPASLTFFKPVKVSVPYDETLIPAQGIDPQDFDLNLQVAIDPPTALNQAVTDTGLKVVTAQTDRLGTFWVSSPNDPVLGDLLVSPPELLLRVGDTATLEITTLGLDGQEVTGIPVARTVVPARVGSVSEDGIFTAHAPGNAIIRVTASSLVKEIAVFVQGDTVGPTSFIHDTPFPTGNDLWGGSFGPGGTLLLAGSNATVLGRSPAGEWTRLFSATGGLLRAVAASGDGKVVAVGTAGTNGVLVTQSTAEATPTLKTFTSTQPQALWFDGTHGMAVGRGNDVLVLHDGVWNTEDSPSFETLLAVVGDGVGGFVTLGSQGSLYIYDPATRTWDSLFQTQLSTLLTGAVIVDAAGSEAWAVGGNRLWHFQGAGWTSENLPAEPSLDTLDAVAVMGGELVIAGSGGGGGHLLRRTLGEDGAEWIVQSTRGPQIIRALIPGADGGYAVGDLGAVWRLTAEGFVEESRGFHGDVVDVSAAADGTVVAAVNECVDQGCQEIVGQVMRRVGPSDWQPLFPQALAEEGAVFSVLARSADDIYVGTGTDVLRWNGVQWTSAMLSPTFTPTFDLASCGGEIWGVGGRGMLVRGPDQLVGIASGASADLYAVSCTDPSNVWLAGDQLLMENGQVRESEVLPHAGWRAAYTPAPGEAFAFGASGYGVYWDTEQLRAIDAPGGLSPDLVSRMWGSSIDNLYAVGFTSVPLRFGFALRFDGAFWRLVDSGASRASLTVDGSSNTDVWIGTRGGGVLRGVAP